MISVAFDEDLAGGTDLTAEAVVGPATTATGRLVAREPGALAGVHAAAAALTHDGHTPELSVHREDGAGVAPGEVVIEVTGRLRWMLTAERVALNLLGHLSGVATRTRAFVDAVSGTGCQVRDTRKTTPGLRLLEKAAVRAGGGTNHRLGLHDGLLVKDNHLAAAADLEAAVRAALSHARGRPVQIEVDALEQLGPVLAAGAPDVLLDNLTVTDLRRAVEAAGGRATLEASGGITLGNVRDIAETGVDRVAVGALTHSAPRLDVALEVEV